MPSKTVNAPGDEPQLSSASKAASILETVRDAKSALAIWVAALPPDEIVAANCSNSQVAARAIAEMLCEAEEMSDSRECACEGLDLMFARNLVGMAEDALWNIATLEVDPPLLPDDVAVIGRLATKFLDAFVSTNGAKLETLARG